MADPAQLIAIVDDEAEVGKALGRLLRSFGYTSAAFTSGPEFLAWSRGSVPDIVLVDIQMPGMSGFEVQEQLAVHHPGVPCVFITASGDAGIARRAADLGAGFLLKPFDETRLLAAVAEASTRFGGR